MAWRKVATIMIIVFGIAVVQMSMAGPLTSVSQSLNETGDYSNEHFDGNKTITELPVTWFDMGLMGMFGIILWGFWSVIQDEINEGRDRL